MTTAGSPVQNDPVSASRPGDRAVISRLLPCAGQLAGWALVTCLASGLLLSSALPPAAVPAPLLVAAAISLSEPLQALAPGIARSRKQPLPTFNFASSGSLQRQIEKGAPVDVFVSAGEKQMNRLEQQGLLLAGTRRVIASNQLVLVVSARSPLRRLSFAGLTSGTIRQVAIGDSTVPAGDYARQILAYYKLSEALKSKLVPLGTARAVAQAVANGDVDAGIVYKSDAQNVANLRITAVAPERSHKPILYSAGVIRSSPQSLQGKAYLLALTTPQALQSLRHYGLLPAPATPVATGSTP